MAKWFYSGAFLLFLGNWIGQIALNWYAYQLHHRAFDLAWINFFRLAPVFLLSIWAGALADRYRRCTLIKLSLVSSLVITASLTSAVVIFGHVPMYCLYLYALLRGCMSAIETPVRQAVLPDLSERLSISKAVSYQSFILNTCRSIGPAISGFLIAASGVQSAFIAQTICYLLSLIISIPLRFDKTEQSNQKEMSLAITWQYFKIHTQARHIFVTALLIMATGYCYATLLPILTDTHYPDNAKLFGIAMAMSAAGGITATLMIPTILHHISPQRLYYISSMLFGVSLMCIYPFGIIGLLLMIFFVGLFGQIARTSNRIYFQNDVDSAHRGKILSVVMMDRGMIPLGALLMSLLVEYIDIAMTFMTMGMATFVIAISSYFLMIKINGGISQ
ncbi:MULTISPECIES: MFS transporter [unclassified Staphylococcus]|uniref:MFS transporter n=1 Tax=unclassified Staphylococcus TaxID=91994 RepID=UPI0021D27BD4|nr:MULTISPECIES: MFS transporter [unclassified Staphylococcus]UXR69203.1 MFS transporter [Staphylococcus sp. IVB6246]UXR71258.1 MFS transporter [Staphylococcus sp. IVB6240]UXR73533.1 MFS transporter [Staphylococcus sp. IVB6238]UXR75850.1 MFS transporter [Staphylococcus sp. IVB6233]UXR80048.1 MFS transporter [Staphylococcus sp. IVB6218]